MASTSVGVVARADPVRGGMQMRAAQEIGAEGLGRLRRDDRGAVEGGRDPAVLHLLHSVHAGYPGGGRSIRARRLEHGPEDAGRGERARGVVDGDPVLAVAAASSAAATLSWRRSPPSTSTTPSGEARACDRSRIASQRRPRSGDHDEVEAPGGGDATRA